jgi:hypothetical protein
MASKANPRLGPEPCINCRKKKQPDKEAGRPICPCCDKLRSSLLVPTATTASNLETLLAELGRLQPGNTPEEKTFAEVREQFLEDNYPGLEEGMHVHPDIFIAKQAIHGFSEAGAETSQDKGNINEQIVYDFLREQFKDDSSFLFHSYKSGIDSKVVSRYCSSLVEKLENGTFTVQEVEERMKKILNVAFLNWDTIEEESKERFWPGGDDVSKCRTKIKMFKSHLNKKSQEKDFFLISLTLASILHFEVKSSTPGNAKDQIFRMRRYLEDLQVPEMTGEWSLMGFVVIPDVSVEDIDPRGTKFQNCTQCKKHMLWKGNIEQGGLYAKAQALIKEEGVVTGNIFYEACSTESKRKIKQTQVLAAQERAKEALEKAENDRRKQNYIQLIFNVVILSNMDLVPHSHAVGKW